MLYTTSPLYTPNDDNYQLSIVIFYCLHDFMEYIYSFFCDNSARRWMEMKMVAQ